MAKPDFPAIGKACAGLAITFEDKAGVARAQKRAGSVLAALFATSIGIGSAFIDILALCVHVFALLHSPVAIQAADVGDG